MNTLKSLHAVVIGSTIGIRDVDTKEREVYTLTRPNEADITRNRISILSPLASAVYGRRAGDVVEVDAPGGKFSVRIESSECEPAKQYARRITRFRESTVAGNERNSYARPGRSCYHAFISKD